MIHGQEEKRTRRARPRVEPLEDRVVLSGASALGTHLAAAAPVAARPQPGAVARFDATVNGFETQAVTQFDRASRRIDRVEATDQGAVARAAAVPLARSTGTIARDFSQFVTRSQLQWNRTARTLDNRLDQAVRRDVRSDPALEPAALAAAANLATRNAELGSRLAGELAAARTTLQAAIGSAPAVAAANVRARTTATARLAGVEIQTAVSRVHRAPVVSLRSGASSALGSAATSAATTSPFLAAGVTTAAQFGTAGSPVNGTGLGPVPAAVGTLATGGVPGSAANGAFGVGTFGGTGDLVGGTQPSPVTGTTGAGVDTGLDTFGIGTGLGVGSGIDLTPNGDGLLF